MKRISLLANLCLALGLAAPRILFAESGLVFDQTQGMLTGQLNVSSNIVAAGSVTASSATFTNTAGAGLIVNSSAYLAVAGGNVGIGTTAPGGLLHIYKGASGVTGSNAGVILESNTHQYLGFQSAINTQQGILFGHPGSFNYAGINWEDGTRGNYLGFTAGGIETMVVKSGNVGIGTTNPAYNLDVNGSIRIADGSLLRLYTGGGSTNDYTLRVISGGAAPVALSLANDDTINRYFQIGYHNTEGFQPKFVVNSYTGNVGIGTTNPGYKLSVVGDIALGSESINGTKGNVFSGGTLQFGAADTAHRIILRGDASSSNINETNLYEYGDILFHSGATAGTDTNSLVIKSGGNVGIGTTNPAAALDVGGTGAIRIPAGTTGERPASPANGMVRLNTATGKLEYYNGAWYGIGAVAAIGGTVTEIGGYRIHTFTTSGTFTVINGGSVDYLVVGGGGSGGGGWQGGGGGAGGLLTGSLTITAGAKTVTIGAGGTGGGTPSASSGGNSTFDSITATGGGYGAGEPMGGGQNPANGGSGGGGSHGASSGPTLVGTGITGQGNNGGQGISDGTPPGYYIGGGGGGAGAVGQNALYAKGGDGGAGIANSISGSSVYYAGGGGGSWRGGTAGAGGTGGGGNGGTTGANGTANTGGGGGAGNGSNGTGASGSGGSGIVIIRYPI